MARGGRERRTPSLQPGSLHQPEPCLAPRRALEQLRGLTETERARGERVSNAGIQGGREPKEEGGGGEKGPAAGGSAPPSPPPPDTTLPFKGPFWDLDLTALEEGFWKAGTGGCGSGTPQTSLRLRLGLGTT